MNRWNKISIITKKLIIRCSPIYSSIFRLKNGFILTRFVSFFSYIFYILFYFNLCGHILLWKMQHSVEQSITRALAACETRCAGKSRKALLNLYICTRIFYVCDGKCRLGWALNAVLSLNLYWSGCIYLRGILDLNQIFQEMVFLIKTAFRFVEKYIEKFLKYLNYSDTIL